MVYTEPLDLFEIFVVTFAGTPELFSFISAIVIAGMAAYFRMPDKIFLVMIGLFAVFTAGYFPAFYLIAVVLTGLLVFYSIARIVK